MTSRYRHWTFTLNNYIEDDIIELRSTAPFCKYLVYGKEVGDSGTPHLQGFVSFSNARQVKVLHNWFNRRAHWEVARNPRKAAQYCKKDGDFEEFGGDPDELFRGQGKRSDIYSLRDCINNGERDRKKLRQDYPDVCAKYPNFVSQLLLDQVPTSQVENHPLRGWQSELTDYLKRSPDARTIVFVVDKPGNGGKTWYTSYYEKVFGRTVTLLLGKKADMIYVFLQLVTDETKVVFVDAPRSKQGEFIQYDFLEELKNGRLMNTKYESRMFEFKQPHVVVMMNEYPDGDKLSEDRIKVINVN